MQQGPLRSLFPVPGCVSTGSPGIPKGNVVFTPPGSRGINPSLSSPSETRSNGLPCSRGLQDCLCLVLDPSVSLSVQVSFLNPFCRPTSLSEPAIRETYLRPRFEVSCGGERDGIATILCPCMLGYVCIPARVCAHVFRDQRKTRASFSITLPLSSLKTEPLSQTWSSLFP